jgi:hypothetical protein
MFNFINVANNVALPVVKLQRHRFNIPDLGIGIIYVVSFMFQPLQTRRKNDPVFVT